MKNISYIESWKPNLKQELDDSNSQIPAYRRFQKQDSCFLRDDLKIIKEEQFKVNYKKQLEQPKLIMNSLQETKSKDEFQISLTNFDADKKKIKATDMYEIKYFFNEKLRDEYEKEKKSRKIKSNLKLYQNDLYS